MFPGSPCCSSLLMTSTTCAFMCPPTKSSTAIHMGQTLHLRRVCLSHAVCLYLLDAALRYRRLAAAALPILAIHHHTVVAPLDFAGDPEATISLDHLLVTFDHHRLA